ncbi:Aryl-alcohol dehydrogenase [Frankia sp. AiPs1]|uniref:NAD(P)-dependent alcohol dehydrogenase n=1 Tax=Frankia sp. AiPa1 TaxID=573492 RepID=UPI00202AC324|nr:NAD(P)-dependent alcohol dehydrogenase [Frankia sp. AiPa1]MCL9763002.1 NAD(P)-dependent alcohol dehydrogenase [Frankia sp. AiPa1]
MEILAAVVEERDGPFSLQTVELDEPGPGEVLVRLVATGICHTDELARHGDLPFPLPGVLGHEGAGRVAAVGAGVTEVSVGDGVVIGWPSCGRCRNCREGQPRYCARLGEALAGGGRLDGGSALRRASGAPLHSHFFGQSSFASHSLTTAAALVKVPDYMPLELMGPLACGISTGAGAVFNDARPSAGDSLVVYGAGTVGLAAVMAARNSAATRIIAVDRHDHRLQLATELGATHVVNATRDEPAAAVHDICGGPADISLECTGVLSVVRQAADSVGMLGTCYLIGGAPAGAEFTLDHISTLWGKRIVGILGGSGQSTQLIPAVMDLFTQGRFPFDKLVEFYDFTDVAKALDASNAGTVIKPILRIGPS